MLYFNEAEDSIFIPFMEYIDNHPREKMIFDWQDGTRIMTRLDTAYDSSNDMDEDEEGFEEYFACAMQVLEIVTIGTTPVWNFEVGGLFEINYHNFPDVVRDAEGKILLEKSKLLAE